MDALPVQKVTGRDLDCWNSHNRKQVRLQGSTDVSKMRRNLFFKTMVWYGSMAFCKGSGLSFPVKYFLLTVPRRRFFCGSFISFLVCLLMLCMWSPAGKGLTSWLSFVMSNCEVVIFPLVSWVRCGA